MKVDSIRNGIVIDHISPGKAMELYSLLNLEALECSVALIKNVPSERMGRKDIIKIDTELDIDLDLVGFVSPSATVNVISDGVITEKKHMALPERLSNILRCRNPRCISSTEQELEQVFIRDGSSYRCLYCDAKA